MVIIAGAGSRKTQHLIDTGLQAADDGARSLIAAYTTENQRQVANRIASDRGVIPPLVKVSGWLAFLINEGAKPFQRAITGEPFVIRGLDFEGEPHRGTSKTLPSGDHNPRYYIGGQGHMYGRNVSDFVCRLNEQTDGTVVDRLAKIYNHILIDEAQDVAGWDYDVLELLLAADIDVTLVADPRQCVYSTNRNARRRNLKFMDWVEQQSDACTVEERTTNYRSNQEICDFADSIFPDLPKSTSGFNTPCEHTGIKYVRRSEVHTYYEAHSPQVLQYQSTSRTEGLSGMNFGLSKGTQFDHTLVFPTEGIEKFLHDGDPGQLAEITRAKLYVAVTRARHSVAFVVD